MFKTFDQHTDCEIRSVIRFLTARDASALEIRRQISEVLRTKVIYDNKVRKWLRAFKDRQENVHDVQRSGQPSVIREGLSNTVDRKIPDDRIFTISILAQMTK